MLLQRTGLENGMAKIGVLISLTVIALSGCGQGVTSEEQLNIEVTKRLFSDVWSRGNVDVLDEIIADGYIKHWSASKPTIGRDQLTLAVQGWRASFPDWNEELDAIAASNDMVFVRWTESGTFTNNYQHIQANGNKVKVAAMGWLRFENGKIVEEWTIVDDWGTQIQIENEYPKEWFVAGWD